MAKKKSGINVEDMIPEAGDSNAVESGPIPGSSEAEHMAFLEEQATLPGVDGSAAAPVKKAPKPPKEAPKPKEETPEDSSAETAPEDAPEPKEEPAPKKKSWGEVMIMEKMNIPVSSDGKDKMVGYVPVEEFDLETGSTVEAEKWLTDQAEQDTIPFGTYAIMRKVKTISMKEVRQVIIEEIED